MFAGLLWLPARSAELRCETFETGEVRAAVQRRADRLGMALVWPYVPIAPSMKAMRVASLTAQRHAGAAFVLGATRLQFCGGYSLEDPEIVMEAAAFAGIDPFEASAAMRCAGRDAAIEDAGRVLVAAGADRLPALQFGATVFCGEERLSEAAGRMSRRLPECRARLIRRVEAQIRREHMDRRGMHLRWADDRLRTPSR